MEPFALLLIALVIVPIAGFVVENFRKFRRRHTQYTGARVQNPHGHTSWAISKRSDRNEPALVYLVRNSSGTHIKIGISALRASNNRLRQHQQNGWRTVRTWTASSLLVAREVEKATLQWWRSELNIPVDLDRGSIPQGGVSETASLLRIDARDCIDFVDQQLDEIGELKATNIPISDLQAGQLATTTGKLKSTEKVFVPRYPRYRRPWGYRRGRYPIEKRGEHWWKVTLRDGKSYLTIEFAPRREVQIRSQPRGARITVTGRVERVNGHLRMTNPTWHSAAVTGGQDGAADR